MVGRALPSLCPRGEDHRGVYGGGMVRMKKAGRMIHGMRGSAGWRSWVARTILIHKALGWPHRAVQGLLVIRFGLRV